jgi:hypothetical protein
MPPALLNADEIAEKFSQSLRTLAKLQGFSEQTVTTAEAGVVLKTCAGRTKVAKPDAVSRSARVRTLRGLGFTRTAGPESITINAGLRGAAGRVWLRTRKDKYQLVGQMSDNAQKLTPSKYHLRAGDYTDVKEAAADYGLALKRALPAALESAGLARQSWVQIADQIGLVLEDVPGGGASPAAIAKARRVLASNGRSYQNGTGTTAFEENKSFFITLINRLPYNTKIGLDAVLLSTLAGRARYFEQNVARGVLASHAETVRAYPWLKLLGVEAA